MVDERLFTPLPEAQRRGIAADFIAFALARDGDPDVQRRTLSRREAFFAELAAQPPPRWEGPPVDQDEFSRWHRGNRPLNEAPPLIAWLVKVARANEGEGWGVDYLLDRGGFDGLGSGGQLQPRDFADLEETYGLTGGHILHGEPSLDQLFTMRPILGWAQYRTPIERLYLCGAGTHPGGGITAGSGHNASQEIIRDLKRRN